MKFYNNTNNKSSRSSSNQKFGFLLRVVFLFILQVLIKSAEIPLPANNFTVANATWTNSTIVRAAVLNITDPNDYIPAIVLPDVIKSNLTNYNMTKESNLTHHHVNSFQSYSLHNNTYLLDSFDVKSFEYYCRES